MVKSAKCLFLAPIFLANLLCIPVVRCDETGGDCEVPNYAGSLVCNCIQHKDQSEDSLDIKAALENQTANIASMEAALSDVVDKVLNMEQSLRKLVEIATNQGSNSTTTSTCLNSTVINVPKVCSGAGFLNRSYGCFKVVADDTKSHSEARAYCQRLGEGIGLLSLADHNKFIHYGTYLSENFGTKAFWVGATREGRGEWTWENDNDLVMRQDEWWSGYDGLSGHCLSLQVTDENRNGFWDTTCYSPYSFVCEKY